MSTKASIAYGKSFHFYKELGDQNSVYLELEDVEFEAGYRRVSVQIPLDVWETIRHLTIARFDLADKTDDELQTLVENNIDERIRKDEQATSEDKYNGLRKFAGAMQFGAADEPRDEQIASGIESYQRERKRQREILERIKQHEVSRSFSENDDLK